MKRIGFRNIGFLFIVSGILMAIVLVLFYFGIFKSGGKTHVKLSENKPGIIITYPMDNTLFPPEIAAPTFIWNISSARNNNWFLQFLTSGKDIYSAYVFESKWQPDSLIWQRIKRESKFDKIIFNVSCQMGKDSSTIQLSATTTFQFSSDSVVAPLFFRKLDLPFNFINQHLSSIEWCLGDISNYQKAKTLLTGVNMCGNCHSFSSDGKVMGIDFDYLRDRGGYASLGIQEHTKIEKSDFFSWNNLSSKGNSSSGFLSVVSPNGRYVVSTINDKVITSFKGDEFRFFPVKGMLGVYDRMTGESYELPGANDSLYVQCNATWSPDGETIIYAKTSTLSAKELKDPQTMKELTEGKKDFRFDLWGIPFNNGKGGIAIPIPGASANGKSNYFPRVSPDGKWIVFTQASAYMLRQLDSKLVIVPFEGGEAHVLECNMNRMNSWHTWSPNNKWIAFCTKGFSPYTKIALTHIDAKGHASPPVLLDNFLNDTKVANLPEFVNIDFKKWNSIQLDFLNSLTISAINFGDVRNGIYKGSSKLNDYHLKLVSATLEIVVFGGKIKEIKMIESQGISDKAKNILERIIQLQTVDVQHLNVKNVEEMALIKAVEDALLKGITNGGNRN
jgi:uncharacterized protein with FMN-binding domain